MNKGIVIATWGGWKEPLQTLLESIKDYHKYPVYIVINDAKKADPEWIHYLGINNTIFLNYEDGFELGALKIVYDNTDLDEMFLMQDTMEVLDTSFFEGIFDLPGFQDKVVSYGKHFTCYLGKYTRKALDKVLIPTIRNKVDALYWEHGFCGVLFRSEDEIMLFDEDFDDSNPKNYYEDKFDRSNFVLVSKYLIKRKATIGPPLNNKALNDNPELVKTAVVVFTPLFVTIWSSDENKTQKAIEEYTPIADQIWVQDFSGTKRVDKNKENIEETGIRTDEFIPWELVVKDTEYISFTDRLNIRRFCDWPLFSREASAVNLIIGDKKEARLKRFFPVEKEHEVESGWTIMDREEQPSD